MKLKTLAILPIFLYEQLKNNQPEETLHTSFLLRYRILLALMVLLGLFLPFVLQQTIYPFFRFGMFAEPVTREIQQEVFRLAGMRTDASMDMEISEYTGISRSNLDYLLRNYYYRDQADLFLRKVVGLMPATHPFDTIVILRMLPEDTSIVARHPQW